MGMFTNFNCSSTPDNRYDFLPVERVDEIIIGATCKHVFKLPFKYSTAVASGVIIYAQSSSDTNIVITITSDMIVEDTCDSIVNVVLSKDQTKLFREDTLGACTKCQIKLVLNDSSTGYSNQYQLKVYEPLDIHEYAGNKLGVHLVATAGSDSNHIKVQLFDTDGVTLLEETSDIYIGGSASGSKIAAISLVDYEDKKQLKVEFVDGSAAIYCDIQDIYDNIAKKQNLIEDLGTIRAKATTAIQPADLSSQLLNKQDILISGTNIKTINSQDILGAGNIDIQGGSGLDFDDLDLYTKWGVFSINGVSYNPEEISEIRLAPGGVYALSGYLKNGHIIIYSSNPTAETTTTQLILNNVYIKSDTPRAIYFNQEKKKVAIKIEENSNNYIIAGAGTVSSDDAIGVIQAEGNFALVTAKNAYLNIKTENTNQHTIKASRLYLSGDGLVEVTSEHDGFHGGKLLRVDSGYWKVLKAAVDGFEAKYLQIFGGTLEIVSCYSDAISSKESTGLIAGYDPSFIFGENISLDHRFYNMTILETVSGLENVSVTSLQDYFGEPIIKESTSKPADDFPTEAELANWTDVPLVDGKYSTSKIYLYVKGYINVPIIAAIQKQKFYADNCCITTNSDACIYYTSVDKKLELKAKEDALMLVINTGSGDAIKSTSSVGIQEDGNYILKAGTGCAINNINYLFTKGTGIKFLLSDNISVKAARFTVGADHADIAEDSKTDMFEVGTVKVNNKIELTPTTTSYCDGKLYFAYGQIGPVFTADYLAADIIYFWKETLSVNLIEDSAIIIHTKSNQLSIDAYTKEESDNLFVLKSVYEAEITEKDKIIKKLQKTEDRLAPTIYSDYPKLIYSYTYASTLGEPIVVRGNDGLIDNAIWTKDNTTYTYHKNGQGYEEAGDDAQFNLIVVCPEGKGLLCSSVPEREWKIEPYIENNVEVANTYRIKATKVQAGEYTLTIDAKATYAVEYISGDTYHFSSDIAETPTTIAESANLVFKFYHFTDETKPSSEPTVAETLAKIQSITVNGIGIDLTESLVTTTAGKKKATITIPASQITGTVVITLK